MASLAPTPTSGYRGRLAPSPTGYLHVGHARTFWTAWMRARDAGGALVMRMEDLDPERSKPDFAEAALDDLRWLGIRWNEGPDKGGPVRALCAKQASRYLQGRVAQAAAAAAGSFPAAVRARTLIPLSARRMKALCPARPVHKATVSLSHWTTNPSTPAPAARICGAPRNCPGPPPATLKCPMASIGVSACATAKWSSLKTRILVTQRFVAGRDFGDFVVWRKDGGPSYQLACVVDDASMRITEVVRGADLLKSTARQILALPRPRLRHPFLVSLPPGRRPQWPPPRQAPRCPQPARHAPARIDPHEYSRRGTSRRTVRNFRCPILTASFAVRVVPQNAAIEAKTGAPSSPQLFRG